MNIDDDLEETDAPPCYQCSAPSACLCIKCNERYFCENHGSVDEKCCDECGDNYNFV